MVANQQVLRAPAVHDRASGSRALVSILRYDLGLGQKGPEQWKERSRKPISSVATFCAVGPRGGLIFLVGETDMGGKAECTIPGVRGVGGRRLCSGQGTPNPSPH